MRACGWCTSPRAGSTPRTSTTPSSQVPLLSSSLSLLPPHKISRVAHLGLVSPHHTRCNRPFRALYLGQVRCSFRGGRVVTRYFSLIAFFAVWSIAVAHLGGWATETRTARRARERWRSWPSSVSGGWPAAGTPPLQSPVRHQDSSMHASQHQLLTPLPLGFVPLGGRGATERGELYLWGSGEPIPRIVSFPGEGTLRVAKVCLGEAHAAVLSGVCASSLAFLSFILSLSLSGAEQSERNANRIDLPQPNHTHN